MDNWTIVKQKFERTKWIIYSNSIFVYLSRVDDSDKDKTGEEEEDDNQSWGDKAEYIK